MGHNPNPNTQQKCASGWEHSQCGAVRCGAVRCAMMITLLLRCTCLLAAVGTSRGVLWVDKKLGREAQNWDPSIPLPGWSTSAPIAYNELLAVDTARFCVASTEVLRLPYALYSQNIDFEDFQELQVIGGGEGGFCTILTATMLRAAGKAKAQEQVIVKIAKDDHPQSEVSGYLTSRLFYPWLMLHAPLSPGVASGDARDSGN
jgi:hypothetical protein